MCDARIRPFALGNDTEVHCEVDEGHDGFHRGTVRDYAFPGSATVVEWHDDDRRSFRGEWPGRCGQSTDLGWCILPVGHDGNHAA